MIPLARPEMGDAEIARVAETIRSGWITQGPRVAEFEAAFARRVGAEHAVAVSNCTTALHLSLLVAGVQPGDEVILSPHSFIASANAVMQAGATPVFVDIDPATLNMDPARVPAAITPRTKAIMAIHQIGRPAELPELAALARDHRLTLIEDAACAIGSELDGRRIGTNHWSPLVCFSFHPRKVLSTGDGGMITTGNPEHARRLRLLRQHGMAANDLQRHQSRTIVSESYPIFGYNYRLTDVQAAIGLAQLERLDSILERRNQLALQYGSALQDVPGVQTYPVPASQRWNQQTYMIRFPGVPASARDAFMQKLLDAGIATRRGIMSIHREECYAARFGPQSFPESESASDQCVCLPLYSQMTESDADTVIRAVIQHRPSH
jgi:dTDP-4-amino-4,6-dideoxygalactose transaminase